MIQCLVWRMSIVSLHEPVPSRIPEQRLTESIRHGSISVICFGRVGLGMHESSDVRCDF